ncbi:hypothetical protein JW758_03365 [Candidatus Peregrinibacteria bacterium]|nr:hypothetical protein [Candidatus Peregrinibacteria bacterium]
MKQVIIFSIPFLAWIASYSTFTKLGTLTSGKGTITSLVLMIVAAAIIIWASMQMSPNSSNITALAKSISKDMLLWGGYFVFANLLFVIAFHTIAREGGGFLVAAVTWNIVFLVTSHVLGDWIINGKSLVTVFLELTVTRRITLGGMLIFFMLFNLEPLISNK